MRIIFIYSLCFLVSFVNIVKGSESQRLKCVICGTIAQYNIHLNLRYCPYCIKKQRGFWHYFITFTKNKNKHINESYTSQYTPLDFMIRSTHRISLDDYNERIFVEFMNAVWHKLNGEDYFFKNHDLQALFLALFDKAETLALEQRHEELLLFYHELRWICLALFHECMLTENYLQHIYVIFKKINATILLLLQHP